ncbi:hypothetical protein B0A50_06627 [Salinomyces thailandicus]|uniref:Uncharacterized protein n=1 Tax=Salinomyces thailandicus TaxID=706561 RepID=A0A4U0TQV8_9PEZI|nr:hypothetical protein B0A50_06627 [Salinomyces thailandica]
MKLYLPPKPYERLPAVPKHLQLRSNDPQRLVNDRPTPRAATDPQPGPHPQHGGRKRKAHDAPADQETAPKRRKAPKAQPKYLLKCRMFANENELSKHNEPLRFCEVSPDTQAKWDVPPPSTQQEKADTWCYQEDGKPSRAILVPNPEYPRDPEPERSDSIKYFQPAAVDRPPLVGQRQPPVIQPQDPRGAWTSSKGESLLQSGFTDGGRAPIAYNDRYLNDDDGNIWETLLVENGLVMQSYVKAKEHYENCRAPQQLTAEMDAAKQQKTEALEAQAAHLRQRRHALQQQQTAADAAQQTYWMAPAEALLPPDTRYNVAPAASRHIYGQAPVAQPIDGQTSATVAVQGHNFLPRPAEHAVPRYVPNVHLGQAYPRASVENMGTQPFYEPGVAASPTRYSNSYRSMMAPPIYKPALYAPPADCASSYWPTMAPPIYKPTLYAPPAEYASSYQSMLAAPTYAPALAASPAGYSRNYQPTMAPPTYASALPASRAEHARTCQPTMAPQQETHQEPHDCVCAPQDPRGVQFIQQEAHDGTHASQQQKHIQSTPRQSSSAYASTGGGYGSAYDNVVASIEA